MASSPQTILYFGDQTDSWADGIDQLYRQAATTPWLQTFLDELCQAVKEESAGMDRVLRDSLGVYSSFLDLADRYRHTTDEVGMAHAVLLHVVRAAMLLQWAEREPQLVSTTGTQPVPLGVCGGLIHLGALAIATDFASLCAATLEIARLFVRLCRLTSVLSRAIEDRPGTWGWAVLGMAPNELRKVLDQFQQSMGIPPIKRAKVGVTGDRWSTVIGPPTVLELVMHKCPALRNLPKNELNFRSAQHVLTVSQADLDYIVGTSAMLESPVLPDFKMWGMDEPEATYTSWGELLRAMAFQVLSKPLDITKVVGQLVSWLGPRHLDVKVVGPSSHTPYLASALKSAGSTASLYNDNSLEQTKLPGPDRIAIVGVAGRGPDCNNIEEFWDVIMSKQDKCEEIPKDRFDIEEFYCSEHGDKCTTTTRFGCFMDKPGNFDPRFFRVSPREALLMDPSHRQFLMSVYEALEVAGYSDGQTAAIDSRRVAAFYGQSNHDWHMVSHDALGCDAFTLQGGQLAFGAGRAAFHFKWEGPTYSLDSACASSTSAMHLACMSLLSKDVDMAVVGSANILSFPHSWTCLSKSGVLSNTGNCKTYRDDADGYCRADFVGTVVLKRLEDAVAQNDNILAVVAGSGRNHSGNSSSITTSDAGAQERLFRKVMQRAHVSPQDISYVEMHGTGTQIGDPAEIGAVTSIFKQRQGPQPLTVGSVKANVGHSEAAAGMASLLKCIMMFQKDTMPPQAGMPHTLNPNFPSLSELKIDIPSESKEFKSVNQKPRRILLNNFDAAGGNACMLLEDYVAEAKHGIDPRSSHVIVTSARTAAAHLANKRNLLEWLRANETVNIQDVAYTTTARRMHHPIRSAYTASTTKELIGKLEADTSNPQPSRPSPIVFVFTGQGSHYAGMGSELYTTCRPFRETVDLCASICEQHNFPAFLDIITSKDVDMSTKDTMQTQLAVVTLEVGLAAFWQSCGVQPSMAMGHSLGEYAALHTAGVLSLADTLYLVGHRARLLLERCEAGVCTMLAVAAPAAAIRELLDARPHSSCTIACTNSPTATVVSGSVDDVAELRTAVTSPSTTLAVPYGFHSFQVDPMLDDYIALAGGVTYSPPRIPVASTLLASVVDAAGVFNGLYLGQQTRQPVDFVGALNAVKENLADPVWLEIGPSPVCSSFVRKTLAPSPGKIMSSLEKDAAAWVSVSKCLAGAYTNGIAVDWLALHAPFEDGLKLLTLPSYAWDLKDFWITYTEANKRETTAAALVPAAPATEPEISTCAQYPVHKSLSPKLEVTLRASVGSPGFKALFDGHRIRGVSVAPGSVFCEAGVAAVKYALQYGQSPHAANTGLAIRDVALKRPLTRGLVGADGELRTTAVAENASGNSVRVSWQASSQKSSYDLGGCVVAVVDAEKLQAGWDRISYFAKARMDELIMTVKNGHGHRMLPGIFYALFSNTVEYDPAFKCVKEVFVSGNFEEAAAEVVLRDHPQETRFVGSPYWGESLVHLAGFVVNANPDRPAANTTFMMDSFDSFEQTVDLEPGKPYFTYARVSHRDKSSASCDVYVFDEERLVIQCSGLRFHEVSNDVLDRLLGNSATSSRVQGKTAADGTSVTRQHVPPEPKASSNIHSDAPKEKIDETSASMGEENVDSNTEIFQIILESISKGTGTEIADLTDDTVLVELGVDSIMGIEIASRINSSAGLDILPSFLVQYPTIGELRNAFARPSTPAPQPNHDSDFSMSSSDDLVLISPPPEPASSSSPPPTARVTLLQGRPSPSKQPFYLIADGTGSIATYIHLPPFSSNTPIYGIDSPYLRCPDRLDPTAVGIPGLAAPIAAALLAFQPAGPLEVCRQVAAAGRRVERLLLIDMCCPRPMSVSGSQEVEEAGWKVYESIAARSSGGGMWSVSAATQRHLRGVFACVAAYHPAPLAAHERPARTAIVWAKKGLVRRCEGDGEVMGLLARVGVPTVAFEGFMEDARMGAIAWGLPDKTERDLGPNGWEKYVGEKPLCLAVEADHLEMPMPGHVHLMHGAMEEAFAYLSK
ncbi:LasS2 [Lasiodiplodia theobromae]|nr:LasS2 [Lasiodiplodia theobromae]